MQEGKEGFLFFALMQYAGMGTRACYRRPFRTCKTPPLSRLNTKRTSTFRQPFFLKPGNLPNSTTAPGPRIQTQPGDHWPGGPSDFTLVPSPVDCDPYAPLCALP
jgi:hypothetical protein